MGLILPKSSLVGQGVPGKPGRCSRGRNGVSQHPNPFLGSCSFPIRAGTGLGLPRENFSWGAKLPPLPLALGGAAPVLNFAQVRLRVDGVVQREGPRCAPRGASSSVVMPSEPVPPGAHHGRCPLSPILCPPSSVPHPPVLTPRGAPGPQRCHLAAFCWHSYLVPRGFLLWMTNSPSAEQDPTNMWEEEESP